ncbi:ABC-type transport auxiliary lipoprotein family protein [Shimia aestuarii]|uniref:Cholesterol transport system auxiliary component n=1 Tax=Shimia aestuarii TaxID=254406 RepID=A0A1I4HLW8_9RHOB|nr:ABC-type transport auxiliary lipoprotein family protein [Shimia aestuarii]SFL42511.1 cholesterol transport system auxiliary component [Shimia aestuarii]
MTRAILIMAVTGALGLSGCAGIGTLNRAATPSDLYALTPKSTFDSNLPRLRQQIIVEEPTATAAVDTDQVAVMPNPLQVQYLPRVRWVDRAPLIVQALLIESFENSGKVAAVGRSTVGLRPDYSIVTDIREFQATLPDETVEDSRLVVDVRLNIKIVDSYSDHIIASSSFGKQRVAASDEMIDIATAFDGALGSAMREAVEWSIRKIHTHAANNPRPALP